MTRTHPYKATTTLRWKPPAKLIATTRDLRVFKDPHPPCIKTQTFTCLVTPANSRQVTWVLVFSPVSSSTGLEISPYRRSLASQYAKRCARG
eukprot:755877-Hanusia_phi.AAC.7